MPTKIKKSTPARKANKDKIKRKSKKLDLKAVKHKVIFWTVFAIISAYASIFLFKFISNAHASGGDAAIMCADNRVVYTIYSDFSWTDDDLPDNTNCGDYVNDNMTGSMSILSDWQCGANVVNGICIATDLGAPEITSIEPTKVESDTPTVITLYGNNLYNIENDPFGPGNSIIYFMSNSFTYGVFASCELNNHAVSPSQAYVGNMQWISDSELECVFVANNTQDYDISDVFVVTEMFGLEQGRRDATGDDFSDIFIIKEDPSQPEGGDDDDDSNNNGGGSGGDDDDDNGGTTRPDTPQKTPEQECVDSGGRWVNGSCRFSGNHGCGTDTFFDWGCIVGGDNIMAVLMSILNWASIGVTLAVVGGIIYGAMQYMTAGGKADQAKKGIGIIRGAVIALVLYFAMFAIVNFLIPGGLFNAD